MRRWLLPLVAGAVLALGAYHLTIALLPRVVMHFAIARVSQGAGVNAFFAAPLATDRSRAIVRPSPDLAYSSCPFDLSDGPVVVTIPAIPAPYWSLSVFDARTDVAFVRNNVEANGQPVRIAIAMAGQPVPDGMQAVRVDDARGIALLRVLIQDRTRFAAIDTARRAARCAPVG